VLPLAPLLLLAWLAWRGAPLLALGLVATGALVHLTLALRFARASLGGVGGHAEWKRETSTRRHLRRSPAWLVGLGLVVAGTALGLWR
jgi:hypothetical protein